MARAQGARAQMALAFETAYGSPPAAGYTQMPFITSSLAAEQPLLASELLGYGRDPRAPLLDAITTDGDVEVPIDAIGFGFWLKAAFGAPTTAGTVAATGAITFSAQPAVNATVTINGTTFTFVASGATGNQVNIGANLAATLTALTTALNASVVPGVALATYTGTATALTIVQDTLGSTGNSFTLAASTTPASNGTVSGATLTGGLNAHTFTSGSWTLPSMSIEVAMPEVPRFTEAEATTTPAENVAAPIQRRKGTKQEALIEMLRAPGGATIEEIATALEWAAHTVRGAMAGALKKKLGLAVTSEKVEGRGRVYTLK